MRVVAVLAAAFLLSSCTWVRHELEPPPPVAAPTAKPELKTPHRPHVEHPAPAPAASLPPVAPPAAMAPPTPPPIDYSARF
jgi:hypothetical protein